jgi:hypothetical protein
MKNLLRAVPTLALCIGAIGTMVASCGNNEDTAMTWPQCFTVDDRGQMPWPHAEPDDEFCVNRDGAAWVLEPGSGMDNWKSLAGAANIPLEFQSENAARIVWFFGVDVTDHVPQNPTGGVHGRRHEGALGFALQYNKMTDDAMIRLAGNSGSNVHGGTAHAVLD